MGIPSYFSHIIRNYSNIIRNLKYFSCIPFESMYMDCNSIIYDAVHSIPYTKDNADCYESLIIDSVISSIDNYIRVIKPTKTIFIAFDGVAPLAKMVQQRTRRNRNYYINNKIQNNNTLKWDTSAITPGTNFMFNLTSKIQYAFKFTEHKYKVKSVIVSGTDEPGEGEHKLFDYLRNNDCLNENIALYGLDSDLIMLSIFHLQYCKNIYIFREAPEFLKHYFPIDSSSDTNIPYFLDMKVLSSSILTEMKCKYPDKQRIYDYVFLCFFLGNDFLPHFPSMNIRTHGIQVILDVYRNFIANKYDNYIIDRNHKIQWKNVNKLIFELSKKEHELINIEYNTRNKQSTKKFDITSQKGVEEYFQNIPIIYRPDELYIAPNEFKWEYRYYKTLFDIKYNNSQIKHICTNYLEGLEWVFKYYSNGCPHWKWKYNFNYPPLLKDLCKYIPHFDTDFIHSKTTNTSKPFTPFLPTVQLLYVLPLHNLDLLPSKIKKFLISNYSNLYDDKINFQWAFCRYFWEAHPILPDISLELLEQWDIQFKMHFDTVNKNDN